VSETAQEDDARWTGDFTDDEWLWAMRQFPGETPVSEVRAAVLARRAEVDERRT
jgi:hypothetical protein